MLSFSFNSHYLVICVLLLFLTHNAFRNVFFRFQKRVFCVFFRIYIRMVFNLINCSQGMRSV